MLVAVVTTLVTNYLLASPFLMFFLIWGILGFLTVKIGKQAMDITNEKESYHIPFDGGYIAICVICPPIAWICMVLCQRDEILTLIKRKFPKFRLPKVRNPFIW